MAVPFLDRPQRGMSLVEITITTAVLAILAGSALPGLHGMLMQRALNGRAAELTTDLRYLRDEALARNEGLRISIQSGAGGSCYVLHTGAAAGCDCLAAEGARCETDAQPIKRVFLPAGAAVQISANVKSMLFDPVHGTSTPAGSIEVRDSQGRVVRHIVNSLGRVQSCTPKLGIPGYVAC